MLKLFGSTVVFALAFSLALKSQNPELPHENPEKAYSWGIIPVASFDADLGIRYGAVLNLFDYRGATQLHKYQQYLFVRLTNSTKGASQAQAILESNTLIRNAYTIAEASFLNDHKLDFFGFNGRTSHYNPDFVDQQNPMFIHRYFYAYHRKLLRLRFDVQHQIAPQGLRLLTGTAFEWYGIKPAANRPGEPAETENLFNMYTSWGIVDKNEACGGMLGLFRLGLVYDTRNDLCYCTDGRWAEAIFTYAPPLLNKTNFLRFAATYREHMNWFGERLTLSYRVSFQQTFSGSVPFYALPFFYDSRLMQDGIGGAFTLRGAMRNRIVAEGFLLGNIETRIRILQTQLMKQSLLLSISTFYDNALVTKSRNLNLSDVPEEAKNLHFKETGQKLHHTVGIGVYLVINRNNVISINYGIPTDPQDGIGGLYVGSSLLF